MRSASALSSLGIPRGIVVTETDTHEASFPLLARVARRRYAYAVSFHGMTREAVLIGGGGPESFEAAHAGTRSPAPLTASGIPVLIAAEEEEEEEEEANSGFSPKNIVNSYCAGTEYQIERSSAPPRPLAAIADAVARVYAPSL